MSIQENVQSQNFKSEKISTAGRIHVENQPVSENSSMGIIRNLINYMKRAPSFSFVLLLFCSLNQIDNNFVQEVFCNKIFRRQYQ